MADLGANLARVRSRIAEAARRAGRRPEDVLLVAVTKTVAAERVREAMGLGLRVFGENRVQEAREKVPQIAGASWHLIGTLQRNKVKEALRLFEVIHSVDSTALAEEISRRAAQDGRAPVGVLIEVNISGEAQKHGVSPEQAGAVAAAAARLPGLRLRGLMGMAPIVSEPAEARPYFRRLREIRDRAQDAAGAALPELSMGMTEDFEIAVEEGATMVRIGRALFA